MNEWLKVFLIIIIALSVIAGALYGAWVIYKRLNRPGVCSLIPIPINSKGNTDPSLIQIGYIACTGGGSAWKPNKISITNKGPGVFYVKLSDQVNHSLNVGDALQVDLSLETLSPNVYYDSTSQYTTPNLSIAVN